MSSMTSTKFADMVRSASVILGRLNCLVFEVHINCSTLGFTIRLVGFTVRDCEKAYLWVSDQVNHIPGCTTTKYDILEELYYLTVCKMSMASVDIFHGHCPAGVLERVDCIMSMVNVH